MSFTDALKSLDWNDILQSLNWSDLASGTIQGICTILAAVIALVAVSLGVNRTHRKNYQEWTWNHLFDALVQLDDHMPKAGRTLYSYVNKAYIGELYDIDAFELDIRAVSQSGRAILRRIMVLMQKGEVRDSIEGYFTAEHTLIDNLVRLDDYNRKRHDDDVGKSRQKYRTLVITNLRDLSERHKVLKGIPDGDLRKDAIHPRGFRRKFRKMLAKRA